MTDPIVPDSLDRKILIPVGGRVMATLLLCLLFWFSLARDREEAKAKLNHLTRESYAASYQKERDKIRESAEQSDGYLIGVTSVLAFFVLVYEGAALGFGWTLNRLADYPRRPIG